MRLRHAAALALVGWYLMVPPRGAQEEKPLSEWAAMGAFDSSGECTAAQHDLVENARKDFKKRYGKAADRASIAAATGRASSTQELDQINLLSAQCVASDDPGLAG